jgi:putative tricarboxylic transport membrane protein
VEGALMSGEAKASANRGRIRFKVRGPRDFYGGLALILLAAIAFWAAGDLPGQSGFAFGPGTAPRMFATLLSIVGGLVALNGLLVNGPPIERYALRGPAFVLTAIFVFAGMMQGISFDFIGIAVRVPPLGLVFSSFSAFMISILGTTEMRWLESLLAAVAMTAFCVAVFIYLLQLPFQLWP